MRQILFIISALIFFLITVNSCVDDRNLNLPFPDELIVVDGWIENGQYATVLLTSNSPYFSSIDSASMRDLVLTRAKITISDGITSEILTLTRNNAYFPPYIYQGNEIIGDTGKIYTISAQYGGKDATAFTTIPQSVSLDTAFFIPEPNSDSLGSIFIEFTDPPDQKNYYRILTKRIGEDMRYFSTMIMGIDDIFFSGEHFGFSISKGPESILSSYGNTYFQLGDTVSIKFCTIDKAHYDFWSSFQDETFNSSNPFASSMSVVKSNIQGSGLGIWGGYGASYYTLVLK